jgi:hypothetical protein
MSRWQRLIEEAADVLGVAYDISSTDHSPAATSGDSTITLGAALLFSFCALVLLNGFSDAMKEGRPDPADSPAWQRYDHGKYGLKSVLVGISSVTVLLVVPGIWAMFIAQHFGPTVIDRPVVGMIPAGIFAVLALIISAIVWKLMIRRVEDEHGQSFYAQQLKDGAILRLDKWLMRWPSVIRVGFGILMLGGLAALTTLIVVAALYDFIT